MGAEVCIIHSWECRNSHFGISSMRDVPEILLEHRFTCIQAEPGFYKASIRMATCQMRLGDAEAARAALEADPRLQAHADVANKLAEIKAHGSRISAVG